jgi:hypothetical protein
VQAALAVDEVRGEDGVDERRLAQAGLAWRVSNVGGTWRAD